MIRVKGAGEDDLPFDRFTLLVSVVDGGSPSLESSVPVYINFEPKLSLVRMLILTILPKESLVFVWDIRMSVKWNLIASDIDVL